MHDRHRSLGPTGPFQTTHCQSNDTGKDIRHACNAVLTIISPARHAGWILSEKATSAKGAQNFADNYSSHQLHTHISTCRAERAGTPHKKRQTQKEMLALQCALCMRAEAQQGCQKAPLPSLPLLAGKLLIKQDASLLTIYGPAKHHHVQADWVGKQARIHVMDVRFHSEARSQHCRTHES